MAVPPTTSRTPRSTPTPSRKPSVDPRKVDSRGKPSPPKRSASTPVTPRPKPVPPKRSATGNYSHNFHTSRDAKPRSSSSTPAKTPVKTPAKKSATTTTPHASSSRRQDSRNHSGQSRAPPVAKPKAMPSSRPRAADSQERHHRSTPAATQHVHRTSGGRHGQPIYVVCDRKHVDDGFYAKCQKVLSRFVTWD